MKLKRLYERGKRKKKREVLRKPRVEEPRRRRGFVMVNKSVKYYEE